MMFSQNKAMSAALVGDESTTMTTFSILMQRCGLSQREASELLEVRLDTVKSWSSGRNPVRLAIINELRDLHRKIERAGQELVAMVQRPIEMQREESGEPTKLEFGLAQSDAEARKLGFPCTGAHTAALGVAIASLPDNIEVEIVPRQTGATMTAIVDWKTKPVAPIAEPIYSKLDIAREYLDAAIEFFLARHNFFSVIHLAAAAEELFGAHLPECQRISTLAWKAQRALQSETKPTPSEREARKNVNEWKNEVKHMNDGADRTLKINPAFAAEHHIGQALDNFYKLGLQKSAAIWKFEERHNQH
jgi:hypothetical protein